MAPETQRIARLTPLADVFARIDALVGPVMPRRVAAADALGRVLAEDAVAAADRPAAAIALRDGYAVAAETVSDASSYAPVSLDPPQRVSVGDELPPGADAVLPPDAVARRIGRVEAIAPVPPGDGVLSAGADVAAGAVLCRAGGRLRAAQVAVLSAAGVATVAIRAPRIHLLPASPGPIVAAAVEAMARAVAAAGGVAVREPAPADFAPMPETDAVVVVGGTGSGRNDASVSALARAGRVEVHGVALLPGSTAAFGVVGTKPALAVPGRLDAALSVWLTLGARMLARLGGDSGSEPGRAAKLSRKVTSPLGMAEVVPVRRTGEEVEPIASGYWPLSAIARADGWILVAADSEGHPAGTEVMVRPWP